MAEQSVDKAAQEYRLRRELDLSRARYDREQAKWQIANEKAREIGLNTVDGAYKARSATSSYSFALGEYSMALRRFCDFLLQGQKAED